MRGLEVEELAWSSEEESNSSDKEAHRRKGCRKGPVTRAAARIQLRSIQAPIKVPLRFARAELSDKATPEPCSRGSRLPPLPPVRDCNGTVCSLGAGEPPALLFRPLNIATNVLRPSSRFDSVPDEIAMRIFRYLPPESLAVCARVCKRWRSLAYDPCVWHTVDLRHLRVVPLSLLHMLLARRVHRLYMANAQLVPTHPKDDVYYAIHGVKEVADGLKGTKSLQVLSFKSCTVPSGILINLQPHCGSLVFLTVSSCNTVCDEELAGIIETSKGLRAIDLSLTMGIQSHSMTALADGCPSLEQANLSWLRVGGPLATQFVHKHPKLVALNVSGYNTEMGNAFLHAIAATCPDMVHLDISDNYEITDAGVGPLVEKCTKLQALAMSRCRSVPFDSVQKAALLPSLQHLNIFGFAPNLMEELVAMRPALHINHYVTLADLWPTLVF